MAKHNGKNGTVKLGADVVVGLTGFSIEETHETQSLAGCGDDWDEHDTGLGSWKGSVSLNLDHGASGQAIRSGDTLAFEGYTEGNATGKNFWSGNIILTGHAVDLTYNGVVTRKYDFIGTGALASAEVV